MPLYWDLSDVKDADKCWYTAAEDDPMQGIVKGEQYLHPTTYTLTLLMAAVGVGKITEENADTVYARLSMLEKIRGEFRVGINGKKGRVFFHPDEIRDHIGLSCNVTNMSDTEWRNHWHKILMDDLKSEYRNTVKRVQEVAV